VYTRTRTHTVHWSVAVKSSQHVAQGLWEHIRANRAAARHTYVKRDVYKKTSVRETCKRDLFTCSRCKCEDISGRTELQHATHMSKEMYTSEKRPEKETYVLIRIAYVMTYEGKQSCGAPHICHKNCFHQKRDL